MHMQALHPCYYPVDVPEREEGLSYTSPVEKPTHSFIWKCRRLYDMNEEQHIIVYRLKDKYISIVKKTSFFSNLYNRHGTWYLHFINGPCSTTQVSHFRNSYTYQPSLDLSISSHKSYFNHPSPTTELTSLSCFIIILTISWVPSTPISVTVIHFIQL